MRLLDALKSSTEYLEEAGIEDAFADAEILTFDAAGADRLAAYMENPEITKELLSKIRRLIRRRAKGEPLQYIVGHVDFLGLTIYVGKGVLIPRPETELLAEEAIRTVQSSKFKVQSPKSSSRQRSTIPALRILDLCSGTGCIALAIAKATPDADVCGTDVSRAALRFAKKNAEVNEIENVSFLEGSLFAPILGSALFDLIVSNPPYIISADIPRLQREIKDWEPLEALDGGTDGLDFYRKIFADAAGHLRPGGAVLCELGFGQAAAVKEIAQKSGFRDISVNKDYAGIDRILKAEL
ncbi:MAG: peptide chain release factor N(5)-glutamine methyltransferase [Nitrospiraceae bacterium]|nr:peptide chain release factor N(5)-glutamine methyltransferase [Nitrospiraceae bacterium]